MAHVVPSHLLDRNLHPFATLQPSGVPDPMGDKAFDEDDADDCGTPAQAVVAFAPRQAAAADDATAPDLPPTNRETP